MHPSENKKIKNRYFHNKITGDPILVSVYDGFYCGQFCNWGEDKSGYFKCIKSDEKGDETTATMAYCAPCCKLYHNTDDIEVSYPDEYSLSLFSHERSRDSFRGNVLFGEILVSIYVGTLLMKSDGSEDHLKHVYYKCRGESKASYCTETNTLHNVSTFEDIKIPSKYIKHNTSIGDSIFSGPLEGSLLV